MPANSTFATQARLLANISPPFQPLSQNPHQPLTKYKKKAHESSIHPFESHAHFRDDRRHRHGLQTHPRVWRPGKPYAPRRKRWFDRQGQRPLFAKSTQWWRPLPRLRHGLSPAAHRLREFYSSVSLWNQMVSCTLKSSERLKD